MDTKKYEVFAKTVELSSLTRAGEELGVTQSAVSHILSALEQEFGFTLIRRGRSASRPTAEGEQLLPFIRELLRQERLLYQKAEELREVTAGEVRVGTFTSVATHWLPSMMQEFQQLHPQVEFRLFNGDYQDVRQWLTDGSVDLGFVAMPGVAGCECVPLYEDALLAILPPDHPLAARERCPVAEVAAQPFITLLQSSDDDVRRALDKVAVKPNVKFTTKDDYAIIAMVERGLGVSIMPELLLRGHGGGVAVRPLDPPASRTLALAVPSERSVGPAARRFAQFAAEWVKEKG